MTHPDPRDEVAKGHKDTLGGGVLRGAANLKDYEATIMQQNIELSALRRQIAEARGVLEKYANPTNWNEMGICSFRVLKKDGGQLARAVLTPTPSVEKCERCGGAGTVITCRQQSLDAPEIDQERCETCNGTGVVDVDTTDANGRAMAGDMKCPTCGGTKMVPGHRPGSGYDEVALPCPDCVGRKEGE